MVKKIFAILFMFVTVITVVSCSEKNKTGENEVNDEKISINEVVTSEKKEEQYTETSSRERSPLLPNTYKVPKQEIYVDTPSFNDIEKGYTELFKDGEKKYVAFTDLRNETVENVKEAFDRVYPKFVKNVSSWHRINGETFTSEENVEVNGIEALRVTGTVKLGVLNYYDCYLYGYGFIFEGVPCAIIGVVSDLDQPQEEIDELTAIVDAMMESVRNEQ